MVVGRKPDLTAARTGASHDGRPAPSPQDAQGTLRNLQPPDDLNEQSREAWDILVPPLLAANILREEDIPLVVEACEAWALVWWFRRQLWAEINGQNDTQRVKHLRVGWTDSLRQARMLLSDLGVGPVSRIRTGLMSRSEGGIKLPSLAELGVGQDDNHDEGASPGQLASGEHGAATASPGADGAEPPPGAGV